MLMISLKLGRDCTEERRVNAPIQCNHPPFQCVLIDIGRRLGLVPGLDSVSCVRCVEVTDMNMSNMMNCGGWLMIASGILTLATIGLVDAAAIKYLFFGDRKQASV